MRAARFQLAQEGILAAAESLATRYGLDDALAALRAARTGPNARDPRLGDLFQSEAVRVFLEGLNTQVNADETKPAKAKDVASQGTSAEPSKAAASKPAATKARG